MQMIRSHLMLSISLCHVTDCFPFRSSLNRHRLFPLLSRVDCRQANSAAGCSYFQACPLHGNLTWLISHGRLRRHHHHRFPSLHCYDLLPWPSSPNSRARSHAWRKRSKSGKEMYPSVTHVTVSADAPLKQKHDDRTPARPPARTHEQPSSTGCDSPRCSCPFQ